MRSTRNQWRPAGETVLGVWAHPDDEAYLSAGFMLRTISGGGRVVCLHATLGEHGTSDPEAWPPERLAAHRAVELEQSLNSLGVTERQMLGYRDGECASVPLAEVVGRLVDLMHEVRPDYVVTFGPDGITGHPDHVSVSQWVTTAWNVAGHGSLLYATTTKSFLREYADVHKRLDLLPPDAPAVSDDAVAWEVRLSEDELNTKRAALAAHASQTEALASAMGERIYRRWYDTESFRLPSQAEIDAARAEMNVS
ncbi:PIG-L family deacetylase [Streptomyces sp. Lzd4kr]|nr:PIG-L family deacetylase [Streptomyces sp. Lzd4kr]